MGQWLVFGWFGGSGTSDTQLAKRKLAKKTHPNRGGRHCPMAAMVPSPRHRRIQQLANMLGNKSMTIKLENFIVFTMYLLAILRHDASLTPVPECLRITSAGGAESIIVSVGSAETIILSAGGAESMMLSAWAESMIVSVPPAESMIFSALFDSVVIMLTR